MIHRKWQMISVIAVCGAAVLAGACSLSALAEEAGAEEAEPVLDEAGLIAVLQSGAAWDEKHMACRRLRQVGTVKAVPALAALLPDETLSHMARYALEPMACPEAGQALRDVLAHTEGMVKAGVVASLGARRDMAAVPLLTPLLSDGNVAIARAAAGALGRIATPDAAKALLDFRDAAPEALRPALAEALLAAGQRSAQDGQADAAAAIYQELLAPSWPIQVRMGAFAGLAYAQPEQAPTRLIEALAGDEPLFRDMAAQIIAETSGADTTKLYVDALATLPAGGQAALLRGLADRKDSTARPAVVQAVDSPDKQVKLAGVKGLAVLGNAADVAALAGLLASDDAETAEAAKASLTAVQAEGVDAAIAAIIANVAPAVRAQLLELLCNRRATQTVPLSLAGLTDADAAVRIAGLRVLALVGGKEETPAIVAAFKKAKEADERTAAEKALTATCSRRKDEVLPIVLDAMKGASPELRVVLLRGLARIGGTTPLDTVVAALGEADKPVSDEAVRLLSNWPTLDAAPHLYQLAQSDDLNRQVLGLRGYVRLAGIEKAPQKKIDMLTKALDLAKRPEEKKLALGGWANIKSKRSLDVLVSYLDDPPLRNEASSGVIAVASKLGTKDDESKAVAVAALTAVVEKCENTALRERAEQALAGLK